MTLSREMQDQLMGPGSFGGRWRAVYKCRRCEVEVHRNVLRAILMALTDTHGMNPGCIPHECSPNRIAPAEFRFYERIEE